MIRLITEALVYSLPFLEQFAYQVTYLRIERLLSGLALRVSLRLHLSRRWIYLSGVCSALSSFVWCSLGTNLLVVSHWRTCCRVHCLSIVGYVRTHFLSWTPLVFFLASWSSQDAWDSCLVPASKCKRLVLAVNYYTSSKEQSFGWSFWNWKLACRFHSKAYKLPGDSGVRHSEHWMRF